MPAGARSRTFSTGQVIGSFQALQQVAAKMFTDLGVSRSAVEAAGIDGCASSR